MLELLKPRGPDGATTCTRRPAAARPVVFGVRQLAVGDLPVKPRRRARRRSRRASLVYDGEIFNAEELRTFVRGAGRTLRGSDDGELFVHLYELEGPSGFRRVDGQFAPGAVGRRSARRWCSARDFLGVRPLYYRGTPPGVVFASEIKALLAVPDVPVEVDEIAASHYLTFLTVPGPRTLFKGVSKLAAGSTATFDACGRSTCKPFWDLLWDAVPEVDDEKFYVDRVRELHDGAVARRMDRRDRWRRWSAAATTRAPTRRSWRARSRRRAAIPRAAAHLHRRPQEVRGRRQVQRPDVRQAGRRSASARRTTSSLLTTDEFLETIPMTIDAMDDLVSEPSSVFLYHALKMAKDQGLQGRGHRRGQRRDLVRPRRDDQDPRALLPALAAVHASCPSLVKKLAAAAAPDGGAQAHRSPAARRRGRGVLLELRDRLARVREGRRSCRRRRCARSAGESAGRRRRARRRSACAPARTASATT